MREAIGPAPWFIDTWPEITGSNGVVYSWKCSTRREDGILTFLLPKKENSDPVLAANGWTVAFKVQPNGIGLWYLLKRNLKFKIFLPETLPHLDMNALAKLPVTSGPPECDNYTYSSGSPVATFEIPKSLPEGDTEFEFPTELQNLDSLLLIANYKDPVNGQDGATYAVYELFPKQDRVKVNPLHWFTLDRFDDGYQWPTKIARDPETGHLIGTGFRIGIFELGDDDSSLNQWLTQKTEMALFMRGRPGNQIP